MKSLGNKNIRNIMSILPVIIAAFTAINGAHYWHQQLKPFKTSQEQTQAIKEALAEGPFVAHWPEADKCALVKDQKFIQFCGIVPMGTRYLAIEFQSWNDVKMRDRFFHKISSDENTIRKQFQWAYVAAVKGEHRRMLSFGSLDILTAKNRYAIKKNLAKHAMVLAHEGVHHTQFPDENTVLTPGRAEEDDADARGISALVAHDRLTLQDKAKALNVQIKFFRDACAANHNVAKIKQKQAYMPAEFLPMLDYDFICESPIDIHAPCKERIAKLKEQIPHIRMDIIKDTIRDEIAWK
jgi:hypothetical protein